LSATFHITHYHDNDGELTPKTFDDHSARTLDHELEISHFHMALKRFCEKHDLKLYWQQADLKTKTIHTRASSTSTASSWIPPTATNFYPNHKTASSRFFKRNLTS
jgi:hypothetical protein